MPQRNIRQKHCYASAGLIRMMRVVRFVQARGCGPSRFRVDTLGFLKRRYTLTMPRRGKNWYHVTIGTVSSWLPGDPRGWRSSQHKTHSSGDHRNPPPHGQHGGYHRHAQGTLDTDNCHATIDTLASRTGDPQTSKASGSSGRGHIRVSKTRASAGRTSQ